MSVDTVHAIVVTTTTTAAAAAAAAGVYLCTTLALSLRLSFSHSVTKHIFSLAFYGLTAGDN